MELELTYVIAVQQHTTANRIIKAWDKADQGGLPGAGRSDYGNQTAGLRMEVNTRQYRAGTIVPEHHPVEGDRATHLATCEVAVSIHQVRSCLQDLKDPLGAHTPPLDKPPGLQQGAKRSIERVE